MKSFITASLALTYLLVQQGCGNGSVSEIAGGGKEQGPDDKTPGESAAHDAHDRSTTASGDQPPSELERAALEGVRKMIADGKDLNSADNEENVPPLFQAAERSHLHVVKLLLQRDADPNVKTSFGESPLHIACRRGNPHIVQLLLERGAVSDEPGGGEGFTPLH